MYEDDRPDGGSYVVAYIFLMGIFALGFIMGWLI